jgi:hypothetical protein
MYANLDPSAVYKLLIKGDFQLNLSKIFKLDIAQQNIVIKLFDDLMKACSIGGMRSTVPGMGSGIEWHPQQMMILFRTLTEQDWLVNHRAVKLDELL